MQMGIWGHHRQATAALRANAVARAFSVLTHGVANGNSSLLSAVGSYNLRFRKADISGRMLGGRFTNYASTAGRFGQRRLSRPAIAVRWATNFGIASYGASIKAVSEGHRAVDALIQAVLTGSPERLPSRYKNMDGDLTEEETEVLSSLETVVAEIR